MTHLVAEEILWTFFRQRLQLPCYQDNIGRLSKSNLSITIKAPLPYLIKKCIKKYHEPSYNCNIKAFDICRSMQRKYKPCCHVPQVSSTLWKKQTSTKFSSLKGILLNNVLVKNSSTLRFNIKDGAA